MLALLLIIVVFFANTFAYTDYHYRASGQVSPVTEVKLESPGRYVKKIELVTYVNYYVRGIRLTFSDGMQHSAGDMVRHNHYYYLKTYDVYTPKLKIQELKLCRYYNNEFTGLRIKLNGYYYYAGKTTRYCYPVELDNGIMIGAVAYVKYNKIVGLGIKTQKLNYKDLFVGYSRGATYSMVATGYNMATVKVIYVWKYGNSIKGIKFRFTNNRYRMIGNTSGSYHYIVLAAGERITDIRIYRTSSYVTGMYIITTHQRKYLGSTSSSYTNVPVYYGLMIGAKAFYSNKVTTLSLRMLK